MRKTTVSAGVGPRRGVINSKTSESPSASVTKEGMQLSEPRRVAEVLIEVAETENPPLHLPLGEDSYNAIQAQLDKISKEISDGREKSLATGYQTAAA